MFLPIFRWDYRSGICDRMVIMKIILTWIRYFLTEDSSLDIVLEVEIKFLYVLRMINAVFEYNCFIIQGVPHSAFSPDGRRGSE